VSATVAAEDCLEWVTPARRVTIASRSGRAVRELGNTLLFMLDDIYRNLKLSALF
jgi:hypothetical protein